MEDGKTKSSAEGQLIGWTGLEYLPETGETEVAYLLSPQFWGRGIATEAARAALKYGLENTGLNSIIGLAHPDNLASRRVLEKCGLVYHDRKVYWGIELCRYSLEQAAFQIAQASSLSWNEAEKNASKIIFRKENKK